MTSPSRPVIAVLCERADDRPRQLEPLVDRVEFRFTDRAGLPAALGGAQALLLWDFLSDALTAAWPAADSLQWVHIVAAGVDRLLFDELVASDIVVTNARGIFERPIAEFVLASILATAKQLRESHDLQREHRWLHRETESIRDQTVLIVGTGAIGREIAGLLRAVGMQVRGAGRTTRTGDPDFGDVVASDRLPEQVGWADHLVVAAPLTDQTRGMVNTAVFAAMKPTAQLINVGRGPIVDEPALLDALQRKQITAAAIDVFVAEPLPPDSPVWTTPGLAVSPHMSGDVVGWRDALARQFVDNAERWLAGDALGNVVDKQLGFIPPVAPTAPNPKAPTPTTGHPTAEPVTR